VPAGDANETFFIVDDVLRVDWTFSINNKQRIEAVQKEVFLVVDQSLWKKRSLNLPLAPPGCLFPDHKSIQLAMNVNLRAVRHHLPT
jgi:hypothetical protein